MQYKNAKYINENGWIDCEILHEKYGWIPYTLSPTDMDKTIDNSLLLESMENNGDISPYVPPSQSEIDAMKSFSIREKRDQILLADVDPIICNPFRWEELTPEKQTEWKDYRKQLLDIPQQEGFPNDVSWPSKPE